MKLAATMIAHRVRSYQNEIMLEILYRDDALIAVNKLANLAVHRSKMVGNAEEFLIDLLREQVGDNVYLAHRLDRATSGVLLIARSKDVAAALGEQFMGRSVHKQYLVVVRGWPDPQEGVIDYPLPGSRETGPRREARTQYRRLATIEVPIELGRYPQQRYALVLAEPESGRFRQIRMTPACCLSGLIMAVVGAALGNAAETDALNIGLLFLFGAGQLAVGLICFSFGARLIPAGEAALIGLLECILGPIWVLVFLGENPGFYAVVGGALVVTAVAWNIIAESRRMQRAVVQTG